MKSKSIWKVRTPCGTASVLRPQDVTYNVECHPWFCQALCASRILPTIWVHKWSVALVSVHASSGSGGHASDKMRG
jgi:hypothetical protein